MTARLTDLCTTALCAGVQTTFALRAHDKRRWRAVIWTDFEFGRQRGVRTRVPNIALLLLFLLFGGCASLPPPTQSEQSQSEAFYGGDLATGSLSVGKATPPTIRSIGKIATKAAPSGAKTPANISAPYVAASRLPKEGGVASEPAKQKMSPLLDLPSLEKRLKETHAIDVLDKIAFRKEVDDLLSQFRAYYQGTLKTSLTELRRPYDLLVLELLSLLQDKDPSLAAAVVASREAIWIILADPAKFAML
jgi:hypothetical protein